MCKYINLLGLKFSRLRVIKFHSICKKSRIAIWRCRCICGNYKNILSTSLKSGNTRSCSCLYLEAARKSKNFTHKHSGKSIHNIWLAMFQRCTNKNNKAYPRYGGRKIKICKRWYKFENFLYDMGERPKKMTLDRINNNKGYSLKNCRWTTRLAQNNNRENTIFITTDTGIMSLASIARKYKIKYATLHRRFKMGYSYFQLITPP